MKSALTIPPIGDTAARLYLTVEEQRLVIDEFRRLMDAPGDLDHTEVLMDILGDEKKSKIIAREHVTGRPEGIDFATACRRANIDYYRFTLTRQALRRDHGDFGFVCDSLVDEYRELAAGRLRVLGMARNEITALQHTSKKDNVRIDHHFHGAEAPTARVGTDGESLPPITAQTQQRIAAIPKTDIVELEQRAATLMSNIAKEQIP